MVLVSAEAADSLKNEPPLELEALNLAPGDYSLHFVTVCMERNACHADLLCQLPSGRDLQPQVSQVRDSLLSQAFSHPCVVLASNQHLNISIRGDVNDSRQPWWTLALSRSCSRPSQCLSHPDQHLRC